MQKKNNLIFFTGVNSIFLHKELDRWIDRFREKHGEFNIIRITRESAQKINIESELQTPPFLAEARLIILDGIPSGAKEKETSEGETSNKDDLDDMIILLLEKIPDNNFVLFVQEKPDERKALYKKLSEICTMKEFPELNGGELRRYIRETLLGIDSDAMEKLIEYKGGDVVKITSELDKLLLFRSHDRVGVKDIEDYVIPEIETSIFQVLDAIYEMKYEKALKNLDMILEHDKIEPVFASMMTNFRKYLFAHYLRRNGFSDKEITDILKIHPFAYQKAIKSSRSEKIIRELYIKLCAIDRKAKTGELLGDGEEALRTAIEKTILDLKNNKNDLQ